MKNPQTKLVTFHGKRTPPHWKAIVNKSILITGIVALLFVLCTVPVAAHTSPDEYTDWIRWTTADALPTDAGNYYLANDIDLHGPWSIPADTQITLCLNGFLIKQDGTDEHVIEIPESATLNLYDCSNAEHYYNEDAEGRWTLTGDEITHDHRVIGGAITESLSDHASGVWINGGTFNMYGGNIIGNNAVGSESDTGFGGGVHMSDGTFNMYGGKIAGNLAHSGGGVDVDNGVFNMYDGEISHNTASEEAGGVDVEGGTFIMYGGEISHNVAGSNAGGVRLMTSSSTFIMEGGSISHNTAPQGAGVDEYSGDFTMRGGEISHNIATSYGGGVNIGSQHILNMEGGCITDNSAPMGAGVFITVIPSVMGGSKAGTLIVSGDAKIKGNLYEGYENNVFITDPNVCKIIVGDDGLSGDANVGVILPGLLTEAMSPLALVTDVSGSNAKYFSADRATEHIEYNEETGSIVLAFGAQTNPVPDYSDVKVTYDLLQRYAVSIPSDILFTPSEQAFNDEVNVTALYLEPGKELVIGFSSANAFHMVLGEPAASFIKYTMSMGETVFDGEGFHEIMVVPAGTSKQGEDWWVRQGLHYEVTDDEIAKAKFAGEHKDMLTFRIEVQDTP